MKGKIVLIPFPFTDLTAAKLRPALVIHGLKTSSVIRLDKIAIVGEIGELNLSPQADVMSS